MNSRLVPLAGAAVLTLAFLSGCSLLMPTAATVDPGDLANAAEDWLEDDEDVKYKVECDDEDEVVLAEDESIDCIATDRDTDLEYDVEITITEVDGTDFEVEVDRDNDAKEGDDSDDDADSDSDSDVDDVFSLVVGDCFNDAEIGIEDEEAVDSVDILDCDEAHEREVYAQLLFEGDDDDFPGESSVSSDTDDFCLAEFEDFVGIPYDESELYFVTFFPTEESWSEGDRESLCMISEYDASENIVPVEGSLEGSQR